MLENQKLRVVLLAVVLLFGATLVAQYQPAEFYFGGKRIFVGMPQAEALAALSTCCKLIPPTITEAQRQSAADLGSMAGQMIMPKDDSEFGVLGSIFMGRGKVLSITRPLGEEAYLPWNDQVLGFARALQRALSPLSGNSETTVHISVRHSRTSNADSEVLSLSFPNGRGVRLTIVTMDKPPAEAPETREQANLEEFLEPPTP